MYYATLSNISDIPFIIDAAGNMVIPVMKNSGKGYRINRKILA